MYTDCGKHDESFRVLADKNQQVSLLVFVEYLEKLLRPDVKVSLYRQLLLDLAKK